MLTRSQLAERRALLTDITYRVDFDLTAKDDGATSRAEIRFRCTQPGATTFADLEVAKANVVLNGVEIPWTADPDGRLQLPALEADNVLIVDAEVAFAADRHGLCTFDDGQDRFIYIKGSAVPVSPPRFMCCFMGAGRATFDLRVQAPAGWDVVSHRAPMEQPDPEAGGVWRFPPQALMDAYLLFFAAGPWASTRGPGPRVYARPSVRDALDASPVPDLLAEVLTYYERILGVDYPFDQRAAVFIPGYGHQGNATPGLWMMHERVLHASVDPQRLRYALWVIAHEAAHSWTVEVSGPNDLWVAEGTATYLCHRAMEEIAPDLHPWASFHVLEEAGAHDGEARPDAHAVTNVPTEGVYRGGISAMAYVKPAALLRHLESIIGRGAVDAGLARCFSAHARTAATTEDLVRCWEEVAEIDLTGWANDWLATAGVNTIELDVTTTGGGLVDAAHVRQVGSSPADRLRTHHITIRTYDRSPAGLVARPPIDVRVSGAATPVHELVGRPAPDLVVLNAPARSYVKVRLDDGSRQTLAGHLGELEPDVRAVCWVSGWEMVKDGLMPSEELRSWVADFGEAEPDPQIRELLAAACDGPLPAWYAS